MFIYQKLMDFPSGQLDFDALMTQNLFESVHRVVNVKIHLHQSHVTGKILSYGQDFCNMKVRENQNQFSCNAHHFFGFVMFFLLKGIRLSVWGTKDIYIGGSGLTNINFESLSSEVKFIDTMKYYLSSLGNLASALDETEKMHLEKLNVQFLNQHDYFLEIWLHLDFDQKI